MTVDVRTAFDKKPHDFLNSLIHGMHAISSILSAPRFNIGAVIKEQLCNFNNTAVKERGAPSTRFLNIDVYILVGKQKLEDRDIFQLYGIMTGREN